ncbi:MAG: purine-nucleoside phosphorylase [Acholeplasmataceae bacterium]|nr:purine-nucleoside phosphorylase [Acholeplasmataceae bacterium]
MIPTPHINLKDKSKIAKTVLMPGDPLRAKFIAETYLTDVVQINDVRNMFGYTGYYKGKQVTVMGSGMGMPSIGIYSYELYNFYDVENIIRIGSAGAYTNKLNLYDVVLAENAYSESSFAEVLGLGDSHVLESTESLNHKLEAAAKKLDIPLHKGTIHSSDVFYHPQGSVHQKMYDEHGCLCVEMESFALFANAKVSGKKAACLLTISDSLVTHEVTSSLERQKSFTKMMEIALEVI